MSKLEAAIAGAREALERVVDDDNVTVSDWNEGVEDALRILLDAIVGQPGSTGLKIDELWCWVAYDPADGNEGIPAFYGIGGLAMPMMGADGDKMLMLRPAAVQAAALSRHDVQLRRFREMTVIETIKGGGDDEARA